MNGGIHGGNVSVRHRMNGSINYARVSIQKSQGAGIGGIHGGIYCVKTRGNGGKLFWDIVTLGEFGSPEKDWGFVFLLLVTSLTSSFDWSCLFLS